MAALIFFGSGFKPSLSYVVLLPTKRPVINVGQSPWSFKQSSCVDTFEAMTSSENTLTDEDWTTNVMILYGVM